MLRAAELEVAIVFEFHDLSQPECDRLYGGIELHPLVDDPMYLALPLGHPLAHKPRVRLQDLSDETLDPGGRPAQPVRPAASGRLRHAGFDPRIGFRSDDYNVVQGMVAAGVGVSLLPSFALANVRDDIVVRSLGKSAPARQIAAATLAGGYRSPATEAMLDILARGGGGVRAAGRCGGCRRLSAYSRRRWSRAPAQPRAQRARHVSAPAS